MSQTHVGKKKCKKNRIVKWWNKIKYWQKGIILGIIIAIIIIILSSMRCFENIHKYGSDVGWTYPYCFKYLFEELTVNLPFIVIFGIYGLLIGSILHLKSKKKE